MVGDPCMNSNQVLLRKLQCQIISETSHYVIVENLGLNKPQWSILGSPATQLFSVQTSRTLPFQWTPFLFLSTLSTE